MMKTWIPYVVWCVLGIAASRSALAEEQRANWGNDPFLKVSNAIPGCPEPLGPRQTRQEWLHEGHYRVERGNSCWLEGRCRLSNAYRYDAEIADAVQRRLVNIEPATRWRERSTLWLMLRRRFIYVQGCVAPDFDKKQFLFELAKTADADNVIDETTLDPKAAALPYRTLAEPNKPPVESQ
jgi:hypothetical protein